MAKRNRGRGTPKPPPAKTRPAPARQAVAEVEAAEAEPRHQVPWYRDSTKLTLIGLVVTVLVALVGDDLVSRVGGWLHGKPSLDDRVAQAIEECREDGRGCKTTKSIVIANGSGELTAVGVDLLDTTGEFDASMGSAVLVFDASGALRWKSPIQSFTPGYGLGRLDTDVTNHLFVSFAVTNHSGIAWVIDPSPNPPQTFGTVGGTTLPITGYDEPSVAGTRRLTAFREGWPANTLNPTTSQDVFKWNGTKYVHTACEVVAQADQYGDRRVLETRKAGTATCKRPIGKYSVDLDGDRPAGTEPP